MESLDSSEVETSDGFVEQPDGFLQQLASVAIMDSESIEEDLWLQYATPVISNEQVGWDDIDTWFVIS